MTCRDWPNHRRWLTEIGQILENYLPRLAKYQMMTYQDWPNLGLWQASWFAKSQKRIWWNQQPKAIFWGFAIPACRKPELIGIFNWLSGDWKTPVSLFDLAKPCWESLSRWKWFYTPLLRWYHKIFFQNLLAFQYYPSPSSSNGRTIPLS
jgi:hypothetical protein